MCESRAHNASYCINNKHMSSVVSAVVAPYACDKVEKSIITYLSKAQKKQKITLVTPVAALKYKFF